MVLMSQMMFGVLLVVVVCVVAVAVASDVVATAAAAAAVLISTQMRLALSLKLQTSMPGLMMNPDSSFCCVSSFSVSVVLWMMNSAMKTKQ
jgi:hypothetical protein